MINHVVCIYSTFIYTWVVKKCFIFLRLDTWNFDTMAVTIVSRKSESDALHLYPEGSSTTNSKAKKSRHLTANTIKTVTIAVKSQLCNVWYLICMHVCRFMRRYHNTVNDETVWCVLFSITHIYNSSSLGHSCGKETIMRCVIFNICACMHAWVQVYAKIW